MRDPHERASDREEHERRAGRQPQHAPGGGQGEVEIRPLVEQAFHRPGERVRERELLRLRVAVAEELQQKAARGSAFG